MLIRRLLCNQLVPSALFLSVCCCAPNALTVCLSCSQAWETSSASAQAMGAASWAVWALPSQQPKGLSSPLSRRRPILPTQLHAAQTKFNNHPKTLYTSHPLPDTKQQKQKQNTGLHSIMESLQSSQYLTKVFVEQPFNFYLLLYFSSVTLRLMHEP